MVKKKVNYADIISSIEKRLAHISVKPVSHVSELESYVRKSNVRKEPIAGGIRKDIYERMIEIDPNHSNSIAFFIRSGLGNIEKSHRDMVLNYLDKLHKFIDENEDLLLNDYKPEFDHMITEDDLIGLELYKEIMDFMGDKIKKSNYAYNEIKRTYDGLTENEIKKASKNLENYLIKPENIELKLSYLAPFIYYEYLNSLFREGMNKTELKNLQEEIETLFYDTYNYEGMLNSINYVLDELQNV